MKTLIIIILVIVIVAVGAYLFYIKYNSPADVGNVDFVLPEDEEPEDPIIEGLNVTVSAGQEFELGLDSNPSTGYSWQTDFDPTMIEKVDSHFISTAAVDIAGAAGQEIFKFRALKAGTTTINFAYSRVWESVQPLNRKAYQITIK